ncbi:hypothetical protein N5D37_13045 [Comamonas aquatica]|uniref:hypothetical protein n=1 Tax=Comamonas aquatica TaxID=225991 RepID=UPI00244C3125|nr:hypothetical protein [Comamonas aquatica]MDH1766553.1 hypothetical protein [Comamonas aquatica]
MTHTSTEQERDLKDIEQALRLVREAHQHEVDAYRPELYKPECDRRPKPQLDRLGDLICLLQNILYAAQQASRRAQVVPKGWKLVPVTPTKEQLRAGYWSGAGEIRLHEEWARRESYERMLAAAPQTPAAAPVELPEPSAWMFGCKTVGGGVSWKLSWSKPGAGVCHRLSGEEFEQPLYTEHQVRELLAAHGIQERST